MARIGKVVAIASCELDGKSLSVETGTLARQADGSVVVRVGDTIVLVSATVAAPRAGVDFFPLLVDFEEKMYAAGKIPGVRYIRREGRPSETAILTARRIDRSIRPLFPEGFRNDVQVVATVLSADPENAPDLPGMLGASAALMVSSIPFEGPIGAVRVGRIGDEFVINPTYAQLDQSDLELTVSLSPTGVVMLEGVADQLPEDVVVAAIEFAIPYAEKIMQMQRELAAEAARPKLEFTPLADRSGSERGRRQARTGPLARLHSEPGQEGAAGSDRGHSGPAHRRTRHRVSGAAAGDSRRA